MSFSQAHSDHLDPDRHDSQDSVEWVTFTRRTEDPKLSWIESQLAAMGIASRRNGSSMHAPILEIPAEFLSQADAWLASPFDGNIDAKTGRPQTVDDVPDDDPTFTT